MWKTMLLLIPVGLALACVVRSGVKGSGRTAQRDLNLEEVRALTASSIFQVTVHPGQASRVLVRGDDNVLDLVRARQTGGHLSLDLADDVDPCRPLEVEIWTSALSRLEASGAAQVRVEGLQGGTLDVEHPGASQVELSGSLSRLDLSLSGAARLQGRDCPVAEAAATLSGAAHAELQVGQRLRADCSGASRLEYGGRPGQVDRRCSGAATIQAHDRP